MIKQRIAVSLIALSAGALVSIALDEGYRGQAYIPVDGDKATIGFGTTDGVKMGDTTTPEKALQRLISDVQKYEGAIKQCVNVPLHQYEYNAFTSLAYNIGASAFCRSTLVKRLNEGNYQQACKEILRWDYFQGKRLKGLTNRREREYRECIGA